MAALLSVSTAFPKASSANKRVLSGKEYTVIKAVAAKVLATTDPNMDFFTNAVTFDLKYRFISIVGEGTFGVAILACDTTSDSQVVIKIAKKRERNSFLEQEAKDLALLNKTDPVHTVKFLSTKTVKTNTYMRGKITYSTSPRAIIVSEYGGMNAYDCITKTTFTRKFTDFMHLFCQAISYWTALKTKKLVQRDIKPENMLIQGPFEVPGSLKFIDPASLKEEGKASSSWYVSSRFFRTPSTILKKHTNTEVPFALAASFYEMLTGFTLFPSKGSSNRTTSMRQHMQVVFDTFGFPEDDFFLSLPQDIFDKFFKRTSPKESESGTGYSFLEKLPPSTDKPHSAEKAAPSRIEKMRSRICSALEKRFICHGKDLKAIAQEVEDVFRTLITNRSIRPDQVLEMPLFQRYSNIVETHLGINYKLSFLQFADSAEHEV